jgi:hypothetical protein
MVQADQWPSHLCPEENKFGCPTQRLVAAIPPTDSQLFATTRKVYANHLASSACRLEMPNAIIPVAPNLPSTASNEFRETKVGRLRVRQVTTA